MYCLGENLVVTTAIVHTLLVEWGATTSGVGEFLVASLEVTWSDTHLGQHEGVVAALTHGTPDETVVMIAHDWGLGEFVLDLEGLE